MAAVTWCRSIFCFIIRPTCRINARSMAAQTRYFVLYTYLSFRCFASSKSLQGGIQSKQHRICYLFRLDWNMCCKHRLTLERSRVNYIQTSRFFTNYLDCLTVTFNLHSVGAQLAPVSMCQKLQLCFSSFEMRSDADRPAGG